jgi:hypothetical protein
MVRAMLTGPLTRAQTADTAHTLASEQTRYPARSGTDPPHRPRFRPKRRARAARSGGGGTRTHEGPIWPPNGFRDRYVQAKLCAPTPGCPQTHEQRTADESVAGHSPRGIYFRTGAASSPIVSRIACISARSAGSAASRAASSRRAERTSTFGVSRRARRNVPVIACRMERAVIRDLIVAALFTRPVTPDQAPGCDPGCATRASVPHPSVSGPRCRQGRCRGRRPASVG